MVKSRDIVLLERELTGQMHPKLVKTLVNVLEDVAAMKQQMLLLASMLDRMADNQMATIAGMSHTRDKLQAMSGPAERAKRAGMEVSSDPTLTGEHDT